MRSYIDGMLRYFEFSGRSTRRQYWLFGLVASLLCLCGMYADYDLFGLDVREREFGPFGAFFALAHALPGVAVTVRRLHDVGRSGWWYHVQCIPLLGTLAFLYWMIAPPTRWDNEFGANPRDTAPAPREVKSTTIPRQVRMGNVPPRQSHRVEYGDIERFI